MVFLEPDISSASRTYVFPDNFHKDVSAAACVDCVMNCQDVACSAEMTDLCTDQCVIVACDDPSHACDGVCEVAHCPLEEIPTSNPDYRLYPVEQQKFPSFSHSAHASAWGETLDAMCSCGDSFSFTDPGAHRAESSGSSTHTHPSPVLSTPPVSSGASPSLLDQSSPFYLSLPPPSAPPKTAGAHTCMWSHCNASFGSMSELVGHVNLQHLRIAPTPVSEPALPPPGNKIDPEDLSCQWGNCHDYPAAHAIPGSSSSTSLDAALGVLAEHLFHDHLGLQQQPPIGHAGPLSEVFAGSRPSEHSPPPSLLHDHGDDVDCAECAEASLCRWQGCGSSFSNLDDLTAHINADHVGAGKAHYECFWEGCARSGEKGFASKQKICRHIQSHTGHRPFQCKLCKQYFSEAATLQQHMRRHTQEKPYPCDIPGCGKAFAIAGALTIHKRTHNGHKPFKCTYCDRAFSESSNLSKHLRTHTGVRPYNCTEPECSKSFSRPDQLARHMSVHKKKVPA